MVVMSSSRHLSLSTDPYPRASHPASDFTQHSGRATNTTTSKRHTVAGKLHNTTQGEKPQASTSGSNLLPRRSVQTQIPKFFLPPASHQASRQARSHSNALVSSSESSDEYPVVLHSTPISVPSHWKRGDDGHVKSSEGGGGSEARHCKKRRLSPAATLLGRAPRSTLRSTASQSQEARKRLITPSLVEEEDEEEEAWMQRARNLTGRHQGKDSTIASPPRQAQSPPSGKKPVMSDRTQRVSPGVSTAVALPKTLPRSPTATQMVAQAQTPLGETPWLHGSLSELSMLPWERDAALKLPQYRNHTGSKVTQRDLQIKRNMEHAMAEKARREAIARSTGDSSRGREERGHRQRLSDPPQKPRQPPPAPSAVPARAPAQPDRSHTPTLPKRVLPRRIPLSPRSRPNVSPLNREKRRCPLSDYAREANWEIDAEASDMQENIDSPLDRRQSETYSSRRLHLVNPIPELPTLRSPRSKRKVYAIETQDGAPLPTPFNIQATGISRLTSRAKPGAPSTSRLTQGPVSCDRLPNTPCKLGDHLRSTHHLSPRSKSKKRARELSAATNSSDDENQGGGYAADSSSPLPSAEETQVMDGCYDDEADETVMQIAGKKSTLERDEIPLMEEEEREAMEETQPLPFPAGQEVSSEEEEEDDLLIPRGHKSRSVRYMAAGASEETPHRRPAKPTGWTSVNEAWEGLNLNSDGTKRTLDRSTRHHQPTLGRYGFDDSPAFRRAAVASGKPTLPRSCEEVFDHPLSRDVTDHLSDDERESFDGDVDDSGFVEGTGEATETHSKDLRNKTDTSGRQGILTHLHPSRTPSEGHASDLAPSNQASLGSQATQPLSWNDDEERGTEPGSNTQTSSHTEDEAVLPMEVLKRMKTKLTQWPKRESEGGRTHRVSRDLYHRAQAGRTMVDKDRNRNVLLSLTNSDDSGSGDSNGWVPEDMPTQMESFFAKL